MRLLRRFAGLFLISLLGCALLCLDAGCSTRPTLAATPNLYAHGSGDAVFAQVPPELQVPEMQVIYVTDRSVKDNTATGPVYGHGRTKFLTYGVATVGLSPEPSWDELVRDSTTPERAKEYAMTTKRIMPLGQFPAINDYLVMKDGKLIVSEQGHEEIARDQARVRELVREQLALTSQKDVYIYVHGFANSFDDSIWRIAELWHFMGRVGVPVAYTWPAGSSGIFAYFQDRESGEFTVYHLKTILWAIIACPEVERIHIIAHSRGTDVATTALREMNIDCLARGKETQKELKLETLVLASPDLDAEVFAQRFFAEQLASAARRTIIYSSKTDSAIGLSHYIFGGQFRLGRMGVNDIKPEIRKRLAEFGQLEFINCEVTGYSTSHDYEFGHPAVLSDMILILRDRRDPGAANGRPLAMPAEGLWLIDNNYPYGSEVPVVSEATTQP